MKIGKFKYYLASYLAFAFFLNSSWSYILTGNIYFPMTSNFTISHSTSQLANKNYYTIPLNVGTPNQVFDLQIDTSVATSWIPSVRCKNCVGAKKLYDEISSTTSSPTDKEIELDDEDGDVEGYKITDNVFLGGYKLKQYGFVQVTEFEEDNFRDHPSGKLGLGYRNFDDEDENEHNGDNDNCDYNFIQKLKKANLISKRVFSINEATSSKGYLFVGDLPSENYTYCNITDTSDLEDIYSEAWVCYLTHVGSFKEMDEKRNDLENYTVIKDGKVNFDSAYDFIGVPYKDREAIENFIKRTGLSCSTSASSDEDDEHDDEHDDDRRRLLEVKSNSNKNSKKQNIHKFRNKEMTITCLATPSKIDKIDLSLSFVLQGNVYSIPIDSLFSVTKKGEMEMMIKYIDDDDAIWTFGYPFMNQFLMIFNMDDKHVGIKSLKKTAIPIINIEHEWNGWYDSAFYKGFINLKSAIILAVFLSICLIVIVVWLIIRAVKKGGDKNDPTLNLVNNEN